MKCGLLAALGRAQMVATSGGGGGGGGGDGGRVTSYIWHSTDVCAE